MNPHTPSPTDEQSESWGSHPLPAPLTRPPRLRRLDLSDERLDRLPLPPSTSAEECL